MFEFGYLLFGFFLLLLSCQSVSSFLSLFLGYFFHAFGRLLQIDLMVVLPLLVRIFWTVGVGVFLDRLKFDYFIHEFLSMVHSIKG